MNPLAIRRMVLGALIGAGVGFAYYRVVGCSTGTCVLTGNVYLSTLWGSVIGGLIGRTL